MYATLARYYPMSLQHEKPRIMFILDSSLNRLLSAKLSLAFAGFSTANIFE